MIYRRLKGRVSGEVQARQRVYASQKQGDGLERCLTTGQRDHGNGVVAFARLVHLSARIGAAQIGHFRESGAEL